MMDTDGNEIVNGSVPNTEKQIYNTLEKFPKACTNRNGIIIRMEDHIFSDLKFTKDLMHNRHSRNLTVSRHN